jgi:hypothetical protein
MFSSQNSQVSQDANYIEDVFSTYLYTGNGTSQTITNGIDLASKGGLNWTKSRSTTGNNGFIDTFRGLTSFLRSNATNAAVLYTTTITSVSSNGYTLGDDSDYNTNGTTYASWTFREQPKFFDVVTYTGTGANRTIAHNLGSAPGCIIVKRTDAADAWQVYHRSIGNTKYLRLNTTAAETVSSTRWNNTDPTDTVFTLGTDSGVNANGGTYVAYLFAHNAGGFGLTGTDNVISCGSYEGNSSTAGPEITLGYEPQWILVKRATSSTGNWYLYDTMRGWTVELAGNNALYANLTNAEINDNFGRPTATGFQLLTSAAALNASGSSYIYIAIRRGPMKVPTAGTSVFKPTASASNAPYVVGFPTDLFMAAVREGSIQNFLTADRLRGKTQYLVTSSTAAEATDVGGVAQFDLQNSFNQNSTSSQILYNIARAPNFMDVVCYTGTGSALTANHNLGVAPELMIVKQRNTTRNWFVYASSMGKRGVLNLNLTGAQTSSTTAWNDTTPTATEFYVGATTNTNASGGTYVAYLFSSCLGVSKVGTYNGNGSTQQINCGFTGGARFVLIKASNASSNWVVFDSARGMSFSTDPYLYLNSTSAEGSTTNAIAPTSSGFEITDNMGYNASGFTYIYLAIA